MTQTAKILHTILDGANKEIGHTVEGVLGRLLIFLYLNGDKSNPQLHGETHNFNYYCVVHGWTDYSLKPYTTTSKLSTNHKLKECVLATIEDCKELRFNTGNAVHEHDILSILNDHFVTASIISNLRCFSCRTNSYFVGRSVNTEVYCKLIMVVRPEEVRTLKTDLLGSEITHAGYDSYSSVLDLHFVIAY